jgi:hypothetical protein
MVVEYIITIFKKIIKKMKITEKIYVKETDIEITKTRKAFIKRLITQKGVVTYSDSNFKTIQCDNKSAYRSISELHIIVKTRFKLTSLKSLIKIIKEIINEEKCIALVWCTQINKVVVKYMENSNGYYITDYSKSNYYESIGVDGYSLKMYDDIYNEL